MPKLPGTVTDDQVGKPEPALVNTCPLVPAAPARVNAVVRLADAIVGAVRVLLVRVWVSVSPTITPVGVALLVVQAVPVDTATPAPG